MNIINNSKMVEYFEITYENITFNLIFDNTKPIPAKCKSPYLYFCGQNRSVILNKFGNNLSFGMIGKILGYCWSNISDEFKSNFII